MQQVSFSNRANPESLYQTASYTADVPSAELIGGMTLRARDTDSIQGLVDFTLDDLGLGRQQLDQDPLDCLSRLERCEEFDLARGPHSAGLGQRGKETCGIVIAARMAIGAKRHSRRIG